MPTSQDFVPIEEIRDGIVKLKNGEMRLVLMVSTTNFDLKGGDEQVAILSQYQLFLNSLDFHIQIYIQSRKFNIKPYLDILDEKYREQTNDLLKNQTREYMEFIKTLTDANNIMSKLFFVIIPYAPALIDSKKGILKFLKRSKKKDSMENFEEFEQNRSQIEQRRDIVIGGLQGLSLTAKQLGTEALVELYYKIFNPGEEGAPTLKETVQ